MGGTVRQKAARSIAGSSPSGWNLGQRGLSPTETASRNGQPAISINEMLLAYWQFAETYYCKDGEPTKELECMKEAIWPLRQLYGTTQAVDFGPQSLKAVRQHMIGEQGLCRNVANRRIGRIKRVFKWAVAEELVPPSTYHGLQALAGLRFGRTEARETEPVKPVDDQHVDAVLPFVTPHVSAMIQVQRLTGMRPDDVVSMRPCDIDQSGEVWIYERLRPQKPLAWAPAADSDRAQGSGGPEAVHGPGSGSVSVQPQGIRGLAFGASSGPLQEGPQDEGLPLRTAGQGGQSRPASVASPSVKNATGTTRLLTARQSTTAFAKAKKAGVEIPHWHPNQLRHTRGTEVRRDHGVEAAQVVLGHARADVTQVYAEKNLRMAIEIARQSG